MRMRQSLTLGMGMLRAVSGDLLSADLASLMTDLANVRKAIERFRQDGRQGPIGVSVWCS